MNRVEIATNNCSCNHISVPSFYSVLSRLTAGHKGTEVISLFVLMCLFLLLFLFLFFLFFCRVRRLRTGPSFIPTTFFVFK